MKPLIIAHRGDTINFPENTIEAFKSAFEEGADGIELDTQLDKGGDVIVVHDYSFDKNKEYPFFEEVLKQFGQKGRLEIEIKSLDPESIKKIGNLIRKYQPKDYELTSSVLPLIPYIKKEFLNEKIGIIVKESLIEPWMTEEFIEKLLLSYMKLTGGNILHLPFEHYTQNIIDIMHANSFLTHTHLKKEMSNQFMEVVKLGIDQITIDDINLIKEI